LPTFVSVLTNDEAAASDALQDFPDGSSGPRSSSCSSSVDDDGISMGLATVSAVLSKLCSSSVVSLFCELDDSDALYSAGADARVVDELDGFSVIFGSMVEEEANSLLLHDDFCSCFFCCFFNDDFLAN
jgi:hypothetical protein